MTEEQLKKAFEKMNARTKPNNWLKMHKLPMRRKPFKKDTFMFCDEMYKLIPSEAATNFCMTMLAGVKKYQI